MTSVDSTTLPRTAQGSPVAPAQKNDAKQRAHRRQKRLVRSVRLVLVVLGLLVLASLVVFALMPEPVVVDAAKVVRGPLAATISESGMTRVKDRFVVSAPVAGMLSRITREPGDPVHEGDVLAEIAPAQSPLLDERARAQAEARLGAARSAQGQTEAQEARAKSARKLAEHELERVKGLYESGSATAQQLEQAQFQARMRGEEVSSAEFARKVAREEVRSARAMLETGNSRHSPGWHVDVISPVSGALLRVHRESAGVVAAGAPLLEVGDPRALEVVVDLLTTDAVQIQAGTPVVLTGWGGNRELEGRVRRVEPSGFTRLSALGVDEQRVNVVVALTGADESATTLADSYHVEARIVLWEGKKILQVPQGAAFRHGAGWAVYRVDSGRTHLVPVSIGHRGDTAFEIRNGLRDGDTVVVHPGDRVTEDARVEIR